MNMKKLSIFLMLALAGWSLTACDESHSDYVTPTVYEQEEVIGTIEGFEATATAVIAANINLDTLVKYGVDSIQVFTLKEGTLPTGVELKNMRFEAWPADKSEYVSTKVTVSNDGWIQKDTLEKLVYTFYGKKATERTFKAKLFANAVRGTEAQLISMGDFTLKVTPQEVENPYYFIYGNVVYKEMVNAYKTVMTPDPESDVKYTYTSLYVKNGDINVWNSKYWLAEKDKKYGIDFSKLYGSGEEKGTNYFGEEGTLKQGAEKQRPSISSPSKAYYTFTVDLEALTYKWTKLENQNPPSFTNISVVYADETETNMEATDNVSKLFKKDAPAHNWYVKLSLTADTELKIRANHDATSEWGFGNNDGEWTVDEDNWAKKCTTDGKNIRVPAGEYHVYFCDITETIHFVPTDF